MNLDNIRNMNDEDLKKYLKILTDRKKSNCSFCGKKGIYTINIRNSEVYQQKKLCSMCESCYKKMLEYLKLEDIIWD